MRKSAFLFFISVAMASHAQQAKATSGTIKHFADFQDKSKTFKP
jgi:hypothetical protein